MTIGFLQINGSGPRNAAVGVFDVDDNLIAETSSDARGFWSIASVPMEVGAYQLRAKMRTESGREHISNVINVNVDDPDSDVDIQAETLDPATVAVMEEIEAERQEKAAVRAAWQAYEDTVDQAVAGYEVPNDLRLSQILNATGCTQDTFWAEVSNKRQKAKYQRLVCTVAAGLKLDDLDQRAVWSEFKKTEEEFANSVDRARCSAGVGWHTSLSSD